MVSEMRVVQDMFKFLSVCSNFHDDKLYGLNEIFSLN